MWSRLWLVTLPVTLVIAACSDSVRTMTMSMDAAQADEAEEHAHEHANDSMSADAAVNMGISTDEAEHEHAHPQKYPTLDAGLDGAAGQDGAAADAAQHDGGYVWHLPNAFPDVPVPSDNPMSEQKVALGRRLFYDTRLSDNQTQSCASCHKQSLAFTDGRKTGLGSTGQSHPRSAMAIVNVGYAASVTWADPELAITNGGAALEKQAEAPLYGTAPVELGMSSKRALEERLRDVPLYKKLFAEAFPDEAQPISADNVTRALAAFERTLISGNSPFDRYMAGDKSALSAQAKRGYDLFFGERLECFHCHAGFNFSDHVHYAGKVQVELHYHNTGLYNVDGHGAYPAPNTGVFAFTGEPNDMGLFKAPTLRNIAVTAPYMHDGSVATLSDALDHYAAGGRTISEGPNKGVGKTSPMKDKLVRGFTFSEQDRADVIAFLESLTDQEFLTNPAFSDPWAAESEESDKSKP